MSDDMDFFRESMGDVKPINVEKKVTLKETVNDQPGMFHRQRAAVEMVVDPNVDPLSGDNESYIPLMDPLDVLEFQRPGVQHGVYKSLRLGKYQVEARIDLHGMDVEHARRVVFQFIQDCMRYDIRCALINHGKGEGRKQPALLKSCVAYWLPQLPEVLAFHSAQKHHGGLGATYFMLKKSESKKQQTLEEHLNRR